MNTTTKTRERSFRPLTARRLADLLRDILEQLELGLEEEGPDRHTSGTMVRVQDDLHAALKESARITTAR
jgi:hypothetical protein